MQSCHLHNTCYITSSLSRTSSSFLLHMTACKPYKETSVFSPTSLYSQSHFSQNTSQATKAIPLNVEFQSSSMSDQARELSQRFQHRAPVAHQAVKFLTASTLGACLLFLSGLTLAGTVIALVMATPLLVLFSPVLVPAAITVFLAVSGLLFSAGSGVAAVSTLYWVYKYTAGQQAMGTEKLDYAKQKVGDTVVDVKEKAKEAGQAAKEKIQDATQTQPETQTQPQPQPKTQTPQEATKK